MCNGECGLSQYVPDILWLGMSKKLTKQDACLRRIEELLLKRHLLLNTMFQSITMRVELPQAFVFITIFNQQSALCYPQLLQSFFVSFMSKVSVAYLFLPFQSLIYFTLDFIGLYILYLPGNTCTSQEALLNLYLIMMLGFPENI